MSTIQEIRQRLNQMAQTSEEMAGALRQFGQGFGEAKTLVLKEIEGSQSNADKEIVSVLDRATQSVEEASKALIEAAEKAKQFAGRL